MIPNSDTFSAAVAVAQSPPCKVTPARCCDHLSRQLSTYPTPRKHEHVNVPRACIRRALLPTLAGDRDPLVTSPSTVRCPLPANPPLHSPPPTEAQAISCNLPRHYLSRCHPPIAHLPCVYYYALCKSRHLFRSGFRVLWRAPAFGLRARRRTCAGAVRWGELHRRRSPRVEGACVWRCCCGFEGWDWGLGSEKEGGTEG
jgi:hypothetical protein